LGLSVILIEKDKLGGTCTNVGCIPAKSLIHVADVKHASESNSSREIGVSCTVDFDLEKAQKWKDGVVSSLVSGIENLCKFRGIEVIKGHAFFTSSNSLSVETESGMRIINFKKAIIATGTKIRNHPKLQTDHKKVLNSTDVFSVTKVPKNLIVIGGGYIAVEMSNMFMKFGSNVSIVHRGDKLLKNLEPEITEILNSKMQSYGTKIYFKSEVERIDGNKALIKGEGIEKWVPFDNIILAIGRDPNLDGLNLEKTKVQINSEGLISVSPTMQTSDENIYAIGDVTPGPQLAHKAFREGKIAAESIAGLRSAFDNRAIPMVVFSDPEIATVGLTESEAISKGYKVKIGKMPFSAIGKAKAMNNTDGFVKVVANEQGTVLGVHIVGITAGSLIGEGALAVENCLNLEDLALTIHPHPTLPEALGEAAEDALGTVIHLYRSKKS
jgi:dihydrolipoamide dehydrogenase